MSDDPKDLARRDALARAAAGELLGPAEVALIFRISARQFVRKNTAREFDVFRANPPIGRRCFSGVLIHRYLAGEPLYEPTFGRKRRTV